ncbi:metabotropic glutamate receptor 3-like [Hydra vulgaris]|uniref:Metabotropic glutamate receptor 3-like n=1 Tax=Hydra vulgaris TaxID=6087 RepID=A0ABM4CEP8_HYDVU
MYWELALEFFCMFVGLALSKLCMETKVESDIKGNFIIPGLFPLRCSSLDDIDMRTVAWIEALKYTVEKENKRQNKSLFDYVVYDTYDSTNFDRTSFAILDTLMFSPNNKIATCACDDFVQQNNILGFLGPSESANCIYALALAMPHTNIPIISYSATSVELDNRILYPNFFRTVPPDNYQALFIIDILKNFHWTYVVVIAIDSSYGRAGIEQLVKVVENDVSGDRICFAFTAILPQVYDPSKYSTVVKNLIKEIAANVIVVIGTFNLVQNLLKETDSQNLTRRTWLLSEATGKNTWFFDYNNHVGNNFLFIVQTEGADDLFKKYFFGLTYQNSSPWLKAVFEKYGVNESTNNFSTNNISQVFDLSMVSFVQDAVKVLIEAFYLYQNTFSTNITQKIYNRTKFNEQIKKVNFPILNNSKTFSFNSNQNPESAYFELYTLSNSTFVNIALWSNNLSLMYLKKNTELNTIKSTCSTPCLPGERKLVSSVSSLKQCCWTCIPCPDNSVTKSSNDQNCTVCDESIDEYPNEEKSDCIKRKRFYWNLSNSPQLLHQVLTLIFCSIGAILSAIFIYTFVIKKKTPIIRSSNYELSLIQLFFHLIMFILPLLTFPEETSIKCAVRIYLGSLLHVVVITIILVKVTRIVAVFNLVNHRKLSTKKTFYIRSKIVLLLVFFPCLFIVLIFVVHKSKYGVYLEDDKREPLQKYCNAHSFWLFHLCYVLLLSTLCGYQTFKGKSLPWKYNETSKIAYSLFFSNITLCALVGLNYSSLDTNTRRFTSCILMSVSMFFLMIILFFSKIKVVWLNPEKNSLSEFRKNSFKTVYSNESLRSASSNQNDFIPSKSFNQDEHLCSAVSNQDESFRSRVLNQEESPQFIALNQFTIEDLLNIEAC